MKLRKYPYPLITILLLFHFSLWAQKPAENSIMLKSGAVLPANNTDTASISRFNRKAGKINGQSFAVIQFDQVPDNAARQQLTEAGITLLEYIPGHAYTVSITGNLSSDLLRSVNARAIFTLEPKQKMHPLLAKGNFPAWAVKVPGTIELWVSFPKTLSPETVIHLLQEKNIEITDTQFKEYQVIGLRLSQQRLNEVAALPFIQYLEPAPHEDVPLNDVSRYNARANLLQAPVSAGGRNLRGQGITVGIGDNANATYHPDFTGRIIDRAATSSYPIHGVHVHGTVGSAGIIEEQYMGYAPKARIVSQLFSGILAYAPAYVQDYKMVITNNSYGNIVGDCSYSGTYDFYSRIMDQQAMEMPSLQHVFAAGNSGNDNCPPYPAGFKTVLGSYQSAKNVITVGNTMKDGTVFSGSSKGPVKDGRIKPEIVATGTGVVSDGNANNYWSNTGTSMSAPAVTGGLALLYQRYRELHGGADPKSALMKAVLCNGATDKGNEGPDYKYGFGWMNLQRSLDILENNHYTIAAVSQGSTGSHIITVPSLPAGIAQLKIMLYWHDPAAAAFASHALVNDLDLTVTTASGSVVFPRILDTLPANVNNTATTGADHLNNVEQVVINNPQAGNYTISVKGTAINVNASQEYIVAYDFVPVSTTLSFPAAGEALLPGENVTINWDAWGEPANAFTIQTTTDGFTWTDLAAPADARQLAWTVPAAATDNAIVRIKRNGTTQESTGQPFVILNRPVLSLDANQCEGYIRINWTAVPGATQYEIMRLLGDEMVSEFITPDASGLQYTFKGLSKDSVYWVSVRAIINGKAGRRATAISRKPDSGTCNGLMADNDLAIEAILSPVSGRQFTYTDLGNLENLTVRIKNLDDAAAANFLVRYRIDGNSWISQNITTPLNAGSTADYTFTGLDLSAIKNYLLEVEVMNLAATDPVHANDTLSVWIKHLANAPVNLNTALVENFESVPEQTVQKNQTGLQAADRFDFSTSVPGNGRLRSFVNTGIAHSGEKALTLDASQFKASGTLNYLVATYNLQDYNVANDDVRLDFFYKSHGQPLDVQNKVWIRGNDDPSTPWIVAYDLNTPADNIGVFQQTTSLEIGDLLLANGQSASAAMQIRWGQSGSIMAADNYSASGFTFDDIRLYKVTDDIQVISIDTPINNSCGLTATVPVKVSVRNSANHNISNIPVHYKIDGGPVVNELIPLIAANAVVQYAFAGTADFSAAGKHTIQAWVDLPTDSYPNNDSLTREVINMPLISSFPYLQNFENGTGNWYAAGKNVSWEFGTPASTKINEAASGIQAWKTRLAGHYNDMEKSYLYSPCFNTSILARPTLSFSVALDLEDCGSTACDMAYIEYSADGNNWIRLGNVGDGINWYNKNYPGSPVWSIENNTRWHVATVPLPAAIKNLRLRFVMESDPAVNREGIAIDDIHVYDNTYGLYTGASLTSPIVQNISGTGWKDFLSGGKLVASIDAGNQNLSTTAVQAYIHTGAVRTDSGQYYHGRNLVIQPANNDMVNPVKVRFYFSDAETQNLLQATGCATCTKPLHAYQLGIAGYTDINKQLENGDIADNAKGNWTFLSRQQMALVPFDAGYYAEFSVNHFSEFWLKQEPFKRAAAPVVQLANFTAVRQANDDVLLSWKTIVAGNVNRFEIEVAKGNDAYQQNAFVKIGELASVTVPQAYQFEDKENNKSGARYYRLKIVNNDGSILYSDVRVVVFENVWGRLYPNPSNGMFNIVYQLPAGTIVQASVLDIQGRVVKTIVANADGLQQKLIVDISSAAFAPGLYLIRIEQQEKKVLYKAVKN